MVKKSKGYALMIVIIVIVIAVMLILGTALLNISLSENKQVIYQQKSNQAYYMARSGADAIASYIIKNPSEAQNIINKTSSSPGTGTIGANSFQVQAMNGASAGDVLIKSTGIVNGVSNAHVSLTLKRIISASSLLDYSVFTSSDLTTPKNITGNVGSNSGKVVVSSSYSGNVTLGPNATTTYTGSVTHITDLVAFPPINDSLFNEQYDGNSTINLTSGVNRYMWVNDLNGLTVNGNAELHLLVKNSFQLKGNSSVVSKGSAKIFIYYEKSDTIDFKGTPSFNGVIYAPNATVDCSGGGNGTFNGSIIAFSFKGGTSNASSFVYDSTLNVSDLVVNGAQTYSRISWGN